MALAPNLSIVGLVLLTLFLLGVSAVLLRQEGFQEGFQMKSYSTEDLEINTCPNYASEVQTARGSTDCCQGDLIDGKCNGSTFCTKSPAYEGVPTCMEAWRTYFTKKGTDLCPSTMRNYFEDVTDPTKEKGCSVSGISLDGKQPMDGTLKKCKVYSSESDNRSKIDSCYTEKRRAKIQCPVVNSQSPEAIVYEDRQSKKLLFRCDYPFELGMPSFCFEKSSVYEYLDSVFPGWRSSTLISGVDDVVCDNYIRTREKARAEANRLQAEQRAREAAEAARKAAEDARARAEADAKRRADEASRLQQQLDEANRRLQRCR